MADLLLDTQAVPSTPASGKMITFFHNTLKKLCTKDDAGATQVMSGVIRNSNTSDVVANAADTYITGANLVVPTGLLMQVGMIFRWRLVMTKTGAGVAAPTWIIRIGTAGAIGDTARITFTGPAQTGVIDTGFVDITAILRNVGASGVMAGGLNLAHNLAATGFANIQNVTLQVTSGTFDTTVANTVIGLSVNPGASGIWTHQVVSAEMLNI